MSHYKIILLYITESIFVFKRQITHNNSFGIYIIHIVFSNYISNLCYIYASSSLISCSLEGHYNFYEHLKKLLNIFIFIALCEIIDNIYYIDIVTIHSSTPCQTFPTRCHSILVIQGQIRMTDET